MDKKSIEDKIVQIEASFNELQAQKKEYLEKIQRLDEESLRLSGEFRLLNSLKDEVKEKKDGRK